MDGWKFYILDDFAPRDRNVDLELENRFERTESIVGPVLVVGIQILDFIWVLLLFCYSFSIVEKRDVKSRFLKFELFW